MSISSMARSLANLGVGSLEDGPPRVYVTVNRNHPPLHGTIRKLMNRSFPAVIRAGEDPTPGAATSRRARAAVPLVVPGCATISPGVEPIVVMRL
jgi:hypothetical protein